MVDGGQGDGRQLAATRPLSLTGFDGARTRRKCESNVTRRRAPQPLTTV
jgi:hypothetical protein